MDNERKLCAFYEKLTSTEVTADALGEDGRVIWSESMVDMTNQAFPGGQVSCPTVGCTCCWARGILVIDQGKLEV